MANIDSTVRLRQLNQIEVSGFVVEIVSGLLNNSGTNIASTGKLTGLFYPLRTNPTGYLRSGDALTQSDLDDSIIQENIYLSDTYYLKSNPSRYITNSGVVFTTGNQTISGIKTFDGSYIVVTNPTNIVAVIANSMGADSYRYADWQYGEIYYGVSIRQMLPWWLLQKD